MRLFSSLLARGFGCLELESRSLLKSVFSAESVLDMLGDGHARRVDKGESFKSSMFMKFWMPISPLAPPCRQLTPNPMDPPGDSIGLGGVGQVPVENLKMSDELPVADMGVSKVCRSG